MPLPGGEAGQDAACFARQPDQRIVVDGLAADEGLLHSAAWNGPGQMMARFEIARAIGSGSAGLFKPDVPNANDQPAFPLIQNALYFNGLKQTLGPSTLAALDSPQEAGSLHDDPLIARA